MKWGLQHVKVTLEESESGETVVIEQSSDGRVTCERGKQDKSERAANQAPRAVKTKAEAPAKPAADKRRKREAHAAKDKPRGRVATKEPRTSRGAGPQNAVRRTSLEWVPVKDHEYDGFAAPSAAGQFKALISQDSQWALFYELKGTWPTHIGCFRKVNEAKKRAQELHDTGWPESEFGPVTAGQIARACPVPAGRADKEAEVGEKAAPKAEEKPAPRKPAPKVEEKPAAPKPEPKAQEKPAAPKSESKGPSESEAAQDQELMSSFNSELNKALDEDEDEDD